MKHCINSEGYVYMEINRISAICNYLRNEDVYVRLGDIVVKAFSIKSIINHKVKPMELVGGLKIMTEEYSQRFKTLSDIKAYYDRYGKLPFALKGVLRKRGWKVVPEKGYYMTIADGNGNIVKLDKK